MSGSNESSEHGVMPDLRIVRLSDLVPHEEHDAQRSAPLVERIRQAGSWLNPPVVAPMEDGRFVILDGANRHYALTELGYQYILVQVVDYESDDIQLGTWHHVVSKLDRAEFLRNLQAIHGLTLAETDLLSARAALARREVLAYTVLKDNQAYMLRAGAETVDQRTIALLHIVNTYKDVGVLNRINTDKLSVARKLYPDAMAIVVFPHYEPAEIIVAARDGVLLPPGISRHVVRGRAMRLHYPLDAFRDNGESLEQKNAQLQSWMQHRMADKRVRYYAEPTFLFDE
ncbi:MAG: ParB N-terminal domain-containing protein [Anaerolineae bacterium]|nr:ParB N-terminal domain-containing protein [Anaerolineae bacterium]